MGLDAAGRPPRRRHDEDVDLERRLHGHLPGRADPSRALCASSGHPSVTLPGASGAAARTVDDLRSAMAKRAAHAALRVRRRTRRVVAAMLAALLGLGGLALPAGAAQGRFDATDGLPDAGVSVHPDLVRSDDDDAYTQGASQDELCPEVGTGSIPPPKDDFSRALAGEDGNILYLGFERSDNNGTAAVDFEVTQSSVDCGNGVNSVRTPGDLLISYDFRGGSFVDVHVRIWNGTEFGEPTTLTAVQAEASIADDQLFGELSVDFEAANLLPTDRCVEFTRVLTESRSSAALPSALKDFVATIPISIGNCASITVVKDATPNGPTAFDFTFDPPGESGTGGFALVDDGSTATPDATPSRRTFEDLLDVDGAYVITEADAPVTPGAWNLGGIECVGGTATYDLANRRVTVVPGGAVDVTCTFANAFDPAPSIEVVKTAAPATVPETGGTVTYTVVVRNLSGEAVTLTDLTDTVAGAAAVDLFTLAGSTCVDGQVLAAGDGAAGGPDTYTCTFTGTVAGDVPSSHVDVVAATAVDDDGDTATDSDDAVVTVTDALPGIAVVKTPSATVVRPGDPVTYTYAVTSTTAEPVAQVVVTDDKCSPVTFVGGDTDGDALLEPGETWTFRCTAPLPADTTNVATATGVDDEGNRTTDTDTASVDVINPAIAIDKTASRTTATSGDTITYTYVVTNPGDSPVRSVLVADDRCNPVTFGGGDANGDAALDPGESWTFTCSFTVGAATPIGDLVNVAIATGTPRAGADVTARDTATVTIQPPAALAEAQNRPPAVAAAGLRQLPRTGSGTGAQVGAALALLVLGGLALVPEHLRGRRRVTFVLSE